MSSSHESIQVCERTRGWSFCGEWKVLNEGGFRESFDTSFPTWLFFDIFLESDVPEEEFGVAPERGDHFGSGDNFTDVLKSATIFFRLRCAPDVKEFGTFGNTSIGQLFKITTIYPIVREPAGIIGV